METKIIYKEDLEIATSLIDKDEKVTRSYFYKQCYPLFKSIYDNYYTDCESCIEFINEIYIVVLSPSKKTGKCQMNNYRGESSLYSWLKSACLFYCYRKYKLKENRPKLEEFPRPNEKIIEDIDIFKEFGGSYEIDFGNINCQDVERLLNLMPNRRYCNLIRLRYLDMKTNEETAEILGVNMDNYYNMHRRAKAQFDYVCRKEDKYV